MCENNKIEIVCPCCKGIKPNLNCSLCHGYGTILTKDFKTKRKERQKRSEIRSIKSGKSHKPFTRREGHILRDERISTGEAARMLGRSIKSIESARYRMRKEEKKNAEKEATK